MNSVEVYGLEGMLDPEETGFRLYEVLLQLSSTVITLSESLYQVVLDVV